MKPEDFESICKYLEESWEGIRTICRKHGYKSASTFYDLKDSDEQYTERYARARERQIDYLEDLLKELVFDESRDTDVIDKVNIGGNAIARDRLKADTLKFILSKLRASIYGARVEINHTGEPRVFNINPDSE